MMAGELCNPRSPLPVVSVSSIKFSLMLILSKLCKLFLALTLLGALSSLATAQNPKSQIKAEIDRLKQSLRENPLKNPDFPDIQSTVTGSVNAASEALDSGNLYLALERLLQAEDLFHGAHAVVDKTDAVKSSFPAFEAEWKKASQNLNALNGEARKKDWRSSPLVVRALAETAEGRSIPLLEGGRGFASSTKPTDGLFYIGQAQGEAVFAKFTASLLLTGNPSSFPLRSCFPSSRSSRRKPTPPSSRRSIDLHPRFIALNSTSSLPMSSTPQASYAGALYQYLEAVRHYGMLEAAAARCRAASAVAKQHLADCT